MTDSEIAFRKKVIELFGKKNFFINKFPDYKQGSRGISGMPDYLVITNGRTLWFEVKSVKTKNTFNLNEIRETQYITNNELFNAGAEVYVAIYLSTGELFITPWDELAYAKLTLNKTSIKKDLLKVWDVKKW